LIAEAIRKGVFDGATPPTLAALIAPFVVDKVRDVEVSGGPRKDLEELRLLLARMSDELYPLQRLKRMRGFETLQIQFWPAACLLVWASGVTWHDLIRWITVDEGDMAMLVSRTADHLRQLLDLEKSHPSLAQTARRALPLILREPVYAL
jgi:superfamily II RNA helicase